jgi:ribosomal protein L34E
MTDAMEPAACRRAAADQGESRCARCGAPFRCGIDDVGGCWCGRLPPLPREAYAEAAGCLCEACLRRALQDAAVAAVDRCRD